MKRRDFVATSLGGAVGLSTPHFPDVSPADKVRSFSGRRAEPSYDPTNPQSIRSLFPRLEADVFINGAGGTPLGTFAEASIDRYLDVIRIGRTGERAEWWAEVWGGVRGRFADLIGANESEIGLVECTKAGEQLALDGLAALRAGGNVVTNDLHFAGSLHNYEGLRRAGRDVRVVRSDHFKTDIERMADAIDDRTALVSVSLVSNVNGHVEPMAELARLAHDRGAIVFADIIQAAGIVPIDVEEMGIDVAACSSYKWLYGIHGAGFLYVRDGLQGAGIPDVLFPGHTQRNYAPWAQEDAAPADSYSYRAPADARRYQPGHVSYLGYAAVHAGLGFIEEVGVETLQQHSVRLNRYLIDQLDADRFEILSTDLDSSPILSLALHDFEGTLERLIASDVVIGMGGDRWDLARISPAIYNTEADMDRLAELLSA